MDLTRKPLADVTNSPSPAAAAAPPEHSSSARKRARSSARLAPAENRFTDATPAIRGPENRGGDATRATSPTAEDLVDLSFESRGGEATPEIDTGAEGAGLDLDGKIVSRDWTDSVVSRDWTDSVVYTRSTTAGRKKDKGKAVAAFIPSRSSCPPIDRTKNIGGNLNMEDDEADLSNDFSVLCQQLKKRRHTIAGESYLLPLDFVEKQRAYFADIDAFELVEEVASDSDSLESSNT